MPLMTTILASLAGKVSIDANVASQALFVVFHKAILLKRVYAIVVIPVKVNVAHTMELIVASSVAIQAYSLRVVVDFM